MSLFEIFRDDHHRVDHVLVVLGISPDPELAARNAERIEQAKRRLGDDYVCAKPILTPKDLQK